MSRGGDEEVGRCLTEARKGRRGSGAGEQGRAVTREGVPEGRHAGKRTRERWRRAAS